MGQLFDKLTAGLPPNPNRGANWMAVGSGLSQLGAGQPVNLAAHYERLQKTKAAASEKLTATQDMTMAIEALKEELGPERYKALLNAPPAVQKSVVTQWYQQQFAPKDPWAGIKIIDGVPHERDANGNIVPVSGYTPKVDPLAAGQLTLQQQQIAAAEREANQYKTIEGADGYKYFIEGPNSGKRVLPDLPAPMPEYGPLPPRPSAETSDAGVPQDNRWMTEKRLELANTYRDDLRQEPAVKEFSDIQGGFEVVRTAFSNPGAVSDYALAVAFAKMVDPGTAAREGEVAAVQSAPSLTQALRSSLTNALTGTGSLPPQARNEILNLSGGYYNNAVRRATPVLEAYEGRASRHSIPFDEVFAGAMPSPLSDNWMENLVINENAATRFAAPEDAAPPNIGTAPAGWNLGPDAWNELDAAKQAEWLSLQSIIEGSGQ